MADAIATLPVDVTANTDGLQAGMADAAKAVQSSTAAMNRAVATVGRTGEVFDKVEGRVQRVGRAFSDARGALELFGGEASAVSRSLAPVAGAIGNVADAFGSLSSAFRGGAAGLGLSAAVPVLGAIVTAATAVYGAYQLLAGAASVTASSQVELNKALELSEKFFNQAGTAATNAAEAERQAAIQATQRGLFEQQDQLQRLNDESNRLQRLQAISRTGRPEPGSSSIVQQDLARDIGEVTQRAQEASEAISLLQERMRRLSEIRGGTEAFGPPAPGAARGGGAAQQAGALEAALNRLATEAGQVRIPTDQLREAQQLLESTRTPAEIYAQKIERLNELFASGAINQETWNRAATQAQSTLNQTATQAENFAKAYSGYGDAIANAFGQAAFQTKKLNDVVKNLAASLAQMIFRQTVGNQLSSAFSNLLGSAVSSIFGTGLTAAPGKTALPDLPKTFASGGRPPLGVASIVGEAGPEWFIPDQAGTILPSGAAVAGGMTYAPVFNINAQGSRMGPAEFRAIAKAASDDAVARVADLSRRGGRYSSDVRGR